MKTYELISVGLAAGALYLGWKSYHDAKKKESAETAKNYNLMRDTLLSQFVAPTSVDYLSIQAEAAAGYSNLY